MKIPHFASPQDAEAAFYDAFERADLEAMMAVWAEDEETLCIHPNGPRLTGVDQIRDSWRQIFKGGPSLRFQVSHHQSLRGTLICVHSVHENVTLDGDPKTLQTIIATNVYLLTPEGWRMVVHHASPSPAAPAAAPQDDPPHVLH